MKEYLKMSYYFAGEIDPSEIVILGGMVDTVIYSCEDAAAHAINSHDELVAEVERLRSHLAQVKWLCEHFANCGGWDINAYSEYVNANINPIWSPPEEVE